MTQHATDEYEGVRAADGLRPVGFGVTDGLVGNISLRPVSTAGRRTRRVGMVGPAGFVAGGFGIAAGGMHVSKRRGRGQNLGSTRWSYGRSGGGSARTPSS